jgi:hypothetical protein
MGKIDFAMVVNFYEGGMMILPDCRIRKDHNPADSL